LAPSQSVAFFFFAVVSLDLEI